MYPWFNRCCSYVPFTSQTVSFHRARQNLARAFSVAGPTVWHAVCA